MKGERKWCAKCVTFQKGNKPDDTCKECIKKGYAMPLIAKVAFAIGNNGAKIINQSLSKNIKEFRRKLNENKNSKRKG